VQDLLESYSHIELTQEEIDTAMLQAKVKKEAALKEIERLEIMEKNRQNLKLVSKDFTFDQMMGFVNYRAGVLLENKVFNRIGFSKISIILPTNTL